MKLVYRGGVNVKKRKNRPSAKWVSRKKDLRQLKIREIN